MTTASHHRHPARKVAAVDGARALVYHQSMRASIGRIGLLMPLLLLPGCGETAHDAVERAAPDSLSEAGGAQPATDSSVAKACDLMTVDDARRITGVELKAGETTTDYMGSSQCRFDRADGGRTGIMIALHTNGEIENYRKVPGSREVSGLADAAVWNSQTNQLAVKTGAAVFSISFLFTPAERLWAVELARAALPRLEPVL